MKKFGQEISSEYVQCNDHGVHLGVTEVLYKLKNNSDDAHEVFVECGNEDDSHDNEDVDDEIDSDDDEKEDFLEMDMEYEPTIDKMRKIVKLFRYSAVKNEILQKIVKKENNGRELMLKLDSKTRWGSLYDSCDRFLKLINPVKEALTHKEIAGSYLWTNTDTEILKVSVSLKKKIFLFSFLF